MDYNITAAGPGGGITFGVQVTDQGEIHPYVGPAASSSPGSSLTHSYDNVTPGRMAGALQVGYGLAGQIGETDDVGPVSTFKELGIGTPGITGSYFYTFDSIGNVNDIVKNLPSWQYRTLTWWGESLYDLLNPCE